MSELHHDPLRAVWDALDRAGCDPRGHDHDYRARCPGHDGTRNDTLHIWTGADGRAMVHCHRGCSPDKVRRALALRWAELFPPGHRSRPARGVGRPVPFADRVLHQLRKLGVPHRATNEDGFWVALCPACSLKHALWIHEDDRRRITLSCAGGCDQIAILRALAPTKEES